MEAEEDLAGCEMGEAEGAEAVKLVVEVHGFYGFCGVEFCEVLCPLVLTNKESGGRWEV